MKPGRSGFLDQLVDALVAEFGADAVRESLARWDAAVKVKPVAPAPTATKPSSPSRLRFVDELKQIRANDPERADVLDEFHRALLDRYVLAQVQDIVHFAQNSGLKELRGKDRRELIPRLMRFLAQQPTEQLRVLRAQAMEVSEAQRAQGFSVLTDKLLSR
jgi:hypothetical protein